MDELHTVGDLLHLRPRPGEVASLGLARARLAAVVRLSNALVFAVAFAVFLVRLVPDPIAAAAGKPFAHWPSGERDLVVVDRTDDPGWQEATRHAVAVWNRSGADLRLTWAAGDGDCDQDGTNISVCTTDAESLDGIVEFQGLTDQGADDGHSTGAYIEVCGDCGLSAVLRRVVATHELGHALGLSHNQRFGSVVYPIGGTDQPDAEDYAELRRIHDHTD